MAEPITTDEYLGDVPAPVITADAFTYKDKEDLEAIENLIEEIKQLEGNMTEQIAQVGDEEQEEKSTKLFGLFDKALEHLETILRARTEEFGELAYENGDIALMYGDLLVRRAKQQNNLAMLSKLHKGINKKMKEEEEANTAPLANAKATTHVFAEDQQEEEEDENEEGQQEVGEDVDDTLEAAWSSLELARVIFTNHLREKVVSARDRKYIQGKLADVYMALADLDRENEQFGQAVIDYQNCLALTPANEHRQIATIHSELAITLLYHQQHAQGLDHLKLAADALQRHHDTSKGDAEHTAELIKDLRIRITEMEEEQEQDKIEAEKRRKEEEERQKQRANIPTTVNRLVARKKEKPAADNKRKREEEENQDENDKKKVKFAE